MPFKPLKQINAIITQQYFEPTVSWALRVMLALNVPLIGLPILTGEFSYNVVWAAFGGYLISLTDYRGLHYKKIVIQGLESILVALAAISGMLAAQSLVLAVLMMLFFGFFAAIIRNWSDYGASIGVAVGFFFLFGLSNPLEVSEIPLRIIYLLAGCSSAILITVISFPLRPSDPVKRSVAKIWNANTELLDALANEKISSASTELSTYELAIRSAINNSVDLFDRNAGRSVKVRHYDLLMELRRISALVSASLSSLDEELGVIRPLLKDLHDAPLNKTLSAFAQCSARIAIVTYTSRPEDFAVAKSKLVRCEATVAVLREAVSGRGKNIQQENALLHFLHALDRTFSYMSQSLQVLENKFNLNNKEYFEGYKLSFNNFVAGVKSWIILDFFKSFMNVNSEQFLYALRVAVLLSLGVFIFKFFNIDHGYWIPLTMIIVVQPYYGATRKKGIERIIGTSAGIIVGGLLMLLPLSHNFFVILLIIDSFFVAYFLRNNYKVGVFFVTVMMVVLMQISQQGSLQLIGWRVLSTFIGAVLALLSGFILWPIWEKQRFPVLFREALKMNLIYLEAVIKLVNLKLPADATWYKFRRLAEEASNHSFASVQRMLEEPGGKQSKSDISFSLVGAGIRINREITSVALIAERNKNRIPITALEKFYVEAEKHIQTLEEYFDIQFNNKLDKTINFEMMKETLSSDEFVRDEASTIIKSEFEKIIFELETMLKLAQTANGKSLGDTAP